MVRAAKLVVLLLAILCCAECIAAQWEQPEFSCDFQGQFPYIVSIRDGTAGTNHICGGVLIASNAVLTAAHCLDPRRNRIATVTPEVNIGGVRRNDPVEKRTTVLAIPHPDWNGLLEDGSNLAILKLDEETCGQPLSYLGEDGAEDRRGLTVAGFGSTAGNRNFSPFLLVAPFDTHNATYCNERYGLQPPLTKQEICARQERAVGICAGDEGSPLLLIPTIGHFRDVLIGIASYATESCDSTEGVSVFMNIWHYRDWINETLESESFINA